MTKQVDIPEDELRQLFREQGIPIWAIAERYKCSDIAIARRMPQCGIEPRPIRRRQVIPPAELPAEGKGGGKRYWGWLPGDPALPEEGWVDITCGYCHGRAPVPQARYVLSAGEGICAEQDTL